MINFENGIYSFTDKSGKIRKSKTESNIQYYYKREFGQAEPTVVNTLAAPIEEFGINERFDFIAKFVSMVADKIQPAMLITGGSGLGKSFTVNAVLKNKGFVDITNVETFIDGERLPTKHYKTIKGFSTPKGLYRLLFENKNSILIIDDADSAITDPVAANLIKAVVDSTRERIVSWNSEMRGEDDLPRSFRFDGGIIFITNLNKEKIPQAIKTRAICVDVTMTVNEKIERMKHIAFSKDFMPEFDDTIKNSAFEIIETVKYKTKELSMRSLIQTIKIFSAFSGVEAENMAKYSLCI